jgi:integrase/recombinase XerD
MARRASQRFWEYFTANIRNRNTRRAYYKAVCRFALWCEERGIVELDQVNPINVASFIEELELSKPTVKQHLAALRMLFDWSVVGVLSQTLENFRQAVCHDIFGSNWIESTI